MVQVEFLFLPIGGLFQFRKRTFPYLLLVTNYHSDTVLCCFGSDMSSPVNITHHLFGVSWPAADLFTEFTLCQDSVGSLCFAMLHSNTETT